ncbi:MAG: hypothetical protein ACI9W2_003585 [Gammaproteobacteria bacterium]|jgi:hypothetical protein
MNDDKPAPGVTLRAVDGGLQVTFGNNCIRIQLTTAPDVDSALDAVVFEEDTHLLLSAPLVLRDKPEHPIRVMTALIEAQPVAPGSVVVRGKTVPYQLMAIVHDVDRSPTWQDAWVVEAVHGVLAKASELSLRTLALPVLGAKHGSIEPERFAVILREALDNTTALSLDTLWLLLPPIAPARRRQVERTLANAP